MTPTLRRLARRCAFAGLAALAWIGGAAEAQTYTSASTAFAWIDPSTHTKVGYNTAPYKFNASAGCISTPPVLDDTLSDAIPIGFTFKFGATNYTTAYIMTNGRLQFGNTTCGAGTQNIGPPQTYPYTYPNASMNNTMKVFGVDLDPTNLVDSPNYPSSSAKTPCTSIAVCYVSFATLGAAPARQFVVTWKAVPEWVNASNTSGKFDLQIILNEDGSFVYQYGSNFQHGGTGTAQVGWQLSTTDYQVLSFGASVEPTANSAIKFFLPGPIATYAFDESAWLPGVAGQVGDSTAGRTGQSVGEAQTTGNGKVCRAANIPANTAAAPVNAVKTGLNLGNAALNLQGTATVAFWYRSNTAWNGGSSAQLLDATAVAGQWFYLSRTAAGALVFEVVDSTGVSRSVSTTAQAFAANTWVHVAVTWNFNGLAGSNQDQLQILINAGTPTTASFTSNGSITAQAGYLYVGDNPIGSAAANGSLNSANGLIDEVQVYNYVLTQAQINTAMNATHACPSYVIHHLEIQHSSGTGVTCSPSTLTLRACADAACSTLYTGGLSGNFSATGSPTVNWDGSTGNGSGANFVIGSGTSSITKGIQLTTPGSVLLGIGAATPTVSNATTCNFGSPSCTFTAADSGFVLTVADHAAESAQTLQIQAVRKSDNSPACTPAFASVNKSVTLACGYANPSSGTLPVRISGTALNASNNAAAACSAGGAAVSLAFDANGRATPTLLYADVGKMNLSATYAPASGSDAGLNMTGSTSFVVKPAGFTLSNIRCTTTGGTNCAVAAGGSANPGAAAANGATFIGAGRAFSATVTATNTLGATTPNYGQETPAEGVKLTQSLVLPAGGALGTLANASSFGGFTAGVATGTAFNWSEVGIIKLTPSVADADYLGAGDVAGTASGNVGRFIPAGFTVSASTVTQRSDFSCAPASSFTYLDENFSTGFTLTAVNAGGGTTTNYTGAFARLDLSQPANLGLAGIAGTTMFRTSNSRLALKSSSGSWGAGVAAGVNLVAAATRNATPDGPFDTAQFGIAPSDLDGVVLLSPNLDTDSPANGNESALLGTIPLRHGRLRVQNAIGAAGRALNLPVAAQYWTGSAYNTNTLDNCTRISAAHLNFGNFRKSLTVADAGLASTLTLASGLGRLSLSAPAAGHVGSLDLSIALDSTAPPPDQSCLKTVSAWTPGKTATQGANLAGLRGAWCGAAASSDPSARATWGLYRGSDGVLYQRENY